jgi:uncharacterized membrane protein YkoI
MGAGAGTLLLVGGVAAGPVAGLAQGDVQAEISRDEAVQIATGQYPGSSATAVELEDEDGQPIYSIELSNGVEVEVHGNSGAILATETEDDADDEDANENEHEDANDQDDANENDDDGETDDDAQEVAVPAGTLDDGEELLSQASITVEQAVAAAQAAATGDVGEVDLEEVDGRLVFNVDIGDHDVKIDAHDGSVVSVDSDD